MSAFDLTWHFLKAGRMPDWSSTDRGYDEDPQFDYMFDLDNDGNRVRRKDGLPLSASVAEGNWSDEDFQNWNQDDSPNERVDAPTMDSNQILRLTRSQLDKLMEDIQSEIQRRGTKRANKNVAVVKPTYPSLEHDRITKPKFFGDSVTPNKEGGSLFG